MYESLASKNLTHIFMIMRDKAIQRRNVFQTKEDAYNDREALIHEDNMEMGCSESLAAMPLPDWTYLVEDVKYNISSLHEKNKKLASLQTNVLRRPSLDDNTEEEKQLNILSSEIQVALERCQSLMLKIKQKKCSGRESLLNKNVTRALANSLQDIKNEFVSACTSYSSTVNNLKKSSSFLQDTSEYDNGYGTSGDLEDPQRGSWSQDQLLFLEDNSLMVEDRERSVQNIFRSTMELNQLFRDVAHLVQEQGTVVDQIDFNIESTSHQVQEGSRQLQKAEKHQRKNRKMSCIIGLSVAVVFFLFLLVLLKS